MYKNILFPVDLEHTKEAEKSLKITVEEAQRSKAKITVMTVAPGFGMPLVASFFDVPCLLVFCFCLLSNTYSNIGKISSYAREGVSK